MRGNRPLEIRLDDATRDRWKAAAADAGYSLSEYVRAAVEDRIAADTKPARRSRAKVKPASVEVALTRARTGMCEHRIPAGAWCSRCDA